MKILQFKTKGRMMPTTEAERRLNHEQSLANTRIEGHVPSAEFLEECEAVIVGQMSHEEARVASLARALAREAADRDQADAA